MPKPIKKRVAKPAKRKEQEVKTIVAKIGETAARGGKRLAAVSLLLTVVVVSAFGYYIYQRSLSTRAKGYEYEGYKLYYGLYKGQPMVEAERLQMALESFQKAYMLGKSPYALFYFADCQYALGRYDEAVSLLRELVQKFPDHVEYVPLAYYKMAMASVKKGSPEEALRFLEDLYGYRSDSYKDLALLEAARILEQMGRGDEAREKYATIVRDFPQSPFFEEASQKVKGGKG
jgi:tetratricopeptide (TPR) repeat protein